MSKAVNVVEVVRGMLSAICEQLPEHRLTGVNVSEYEALSQVTVSVTLKLGAGMTAAEQVQAESHKGWLAPFRRA